ncbi:MAG: hypothetical protein C7N36_20920, partial [Bacteroidetes bacterium]
GNDVYDMNCMCAGQPLDCVGVPGGTTLPGSSCDDGNPGTANDVYDMNCMCAGTPLPLDCVGVPGGTTLPGSSCDDGNPNTENDVYDMDCLCAGTPVMVNRCGIAYWNMTTDAATTNTVPNAVISVIGRGNNNGTTTLLTTTSASSGYTEASGTSNAGAAAFVGALNTATSTYFEVTVTPAMGYVFTLDGINFGTRSTSTAPQLYSIRTSADNFAADVASGAIANNSSWALKTNTGLSVASGTGTPLVIRIYGSNGTGSPGANTANWRIDDLNLGGCSSLAQAICAITDAGLADVTCNTGQNPADAADDFITFTLDPVASGNGTDYLVSVSAGTIMAGSGTYGAPTTFTLNPGSAGAGDVVVTITDDTDPSCVFMVTITDPGSCSVSVCVPPAAPIADNVTYCAGALAAPLTATGENGATFTWYDGDPNNGGTALPGAPTPATSVAGTTSFYVTQSLVADCESPATEVVVTIRELFEVSAVQTCVDAFSYNLEVCFSAVNLGTSDMFTVNIGETTFGPFMYSTSAGDGSDQYCVTIAGAGDPRNTEELLIVVKDGDVTDGFETVLENRIIGATSFENGATGAQYTDTQDGMTSHDLVNNPGQSEVDFTGDGTELGVDAVFISNGNADGLSDGDFTGFSGFTGDVGAYTDGAQGYQLSDTDGAVELTFESVDVSVCESVEFTMDFFVGETGWETTNPADAIFVYLAFEDESIQTLLDTRGLDIDDLNIEGSWMTLSATITGHTAATLMVYFESNAAAEYIYFDNISFAGTACATAGSVPQMCSASTTFTEEACFECPVIGMTADVPAVCLGGTFDLTVSGLSGFAAAMNLETDFSVDFVYFTGAAPADPYTGGTSLGMVMNADFTGVDPDQMAMLTGVGADLGAGTYTICAILDPTAMGDAACQPYACTTVTVNPLPTIGEEEDITVCDGGSTLITPTSGQVTVMTNATDLLISQYIEGGGLNKCIEIFNGTGAAVNLSAYTVALYSNGAAMPSAMFMLPNTMLADGDVYVICNGGGDFSLVAMADITNNATMNFNGDDAVAILTGGAVVDAIGQIGFDPGSAWFGGMGVTTLNRTLVRKSTVSTGNDGTGAFDPSVEYDVLPQDSAEGLGSHVFNATAQEPATAYNFYADAEGNTLLAGNAASYDPETSLENTPETIYVRAFDPETGCESSTSTAVTVTVVDCQITITDPCSCNDDASPITYNAATGVYTNPNDGTFGETVSITAPVGAAALPAGYDFRVTAVTNATDVAVGDALTYNAGVYSISFNHPDDIGYTITIDLFENNQPRGLNLTIGNTCAYPNPVFDPALDAIY